MRMSATSVALKEFVSYAMRHDARFAGNISHHGPAIYVENWSVRTMVPKRQRLQSAKCVRRMSDEVFDHPSRHG